jgi:hypothetical protein
MKAGPSRLLVATLAGLVLFGLAFIGRDRVLELRTSPGSRDNDLFAAVAARVAAGEPYYTVMADELPARGYPVRPVFAWRLPTLSWLLAGLPLGVAQVLLWAIGALTIWAWARVLRLRVGVVVLGLIAPLWLVFSSAALYMYEIWAGQLLALGLALWMLGRDRAAIGALFLAAAVREHSLLALALVAGAAWRQDRSMRLWIAAGAGLAVIYGAHIAAVVQHTPAKGIANGWGGLSGWAFIVSAIKAHVLLITAPYWVAALVAAICVPALWLWREGRIVAVVVSAYAAVFCVVARPDNWYWGLLIIPLMPLGCIALGRETLSSRVVRNAKRAVPASTT